MKTNTCLLFAGMLLAVTALANAAVDHGIPWSELGAKAGTDYKGDGLAVISSTQGARLRCAFQRLEGEVTPEGLWLSSTVSNGLSERFRVVAAAVGRQSEAVERGASERRSAESSVHASRCDARRLEVTGTVQVADKLVRFIRPGLVEEYRVSVDGVRQDFVVLERPKGAGELAVRLAVSGATVKPTASGVQLVLQESGRKIAYSRLRVTDARGKELPARMEVVCNSAPCTPHSTLAMAVAVNDTNALYPIRIDPTFSDANWISMNPSIPGTDGPVHAAVADGSGDIYIGGEFKAAGGVIANGVAKWIFPNRNHIILRLHSTDVVVGSAHPDSWNDREPVVNGGWQRKLME